MMEFLNISVFLRREIHRISAKKHSAESIENWQPPKQQQELLPVFFTRSFPVCCFKAGFYSSNFLQVIKRTSPSFKTLLVLSTKKMKKTLVPSIQPSPLSKSIYSWGRGTKKKTGCWFLWKIWSSKWVHLPQVGMNINNIFELTPPRKHLPHPSTQPSLGESGLRPAGSVSGRSSCACCHVVLWSKNPGKLLGNWRFYKET